VSVGIDDPAEAERIFHALAEKGTVSMPIQKTFGPSVLACWWTDSDIPWMINCEEAD